jgi:hypothetical protein
MCLDDVNHDLLNLLPSVVELKNDEFQTAEQNLAELERSVWKLKQKLEDARAWKPVANGQPEDEMLCAQQKSAKEAFDKERVALENAKGAREYARVALEKAKKDWQEYQEKHDSNDDDSLLDGEIRGNEEVNEEGDDGSSENEDDSSDSADEEVDEEVDDDSLLDGEIRGNDEEVNEEVNDDSLLDGEIRGNDEEDGSRENEDDSSDSADEEGNEEVNEEGDDGSSENDTPLSTKQRKRRQRRENAKKRRKTDRPVQKQPQIAQPDVSSENGNDEAVGNTQSLPSFLKQELHSTQQENEKIKEQLNGFLVEMNTLIAAQQQELNDIKDDVQSPDKKLFEIILCSCLACAAAPSLQAPFLNNRVINAESLLADLIGYDKSNDTYTEEECQKAVHSAKTILHMAEELTNQRGSSTKLANYPPQICMILVQVFTIRNIYERCSEHVLTDSTFSSNVCKELLESCRVSAIAKIEVHGGNVDNDIIANEASEIMLEWGKTAQWNAETEKTSKISHQRTYSFKQWSHDVCINAVNYILKPHKNKHKVKFPSKELQTIVFEKECDTLMLQVKQITAMSQDVGNAKDEKDFVCNAKKLLSELATEKMWQIYRVFLIKIANLLSKEDKPTSHGDDAKLKWEKTHLVTAVTNWLSSLCTFYKDRQLVLRHWVEKNLVIPNNKLPSDILHNRTVSIRTFDRLGLVQNLVPSFAQQLPGYWLERIQFPNWLSDRSLFLKKADKPKNCDGAANLWLQVTYDFLHERLHMATVTAMTIDEYAETMETKCAKFIGDSNAPKSNDSFIRHLKGQYIDTTDRKHIEATFTSDPEVLKGVLSLLTQVAHFAPLVQHAFYRVIQLDLELLARRNAARDGDEISLRDNKVVSKTKQTERNKYAVQGRNFFLAIWRTIMHVVNMAHKSHDVSKSVSLLWYVLHASGLARFLGFNSDTDWLKKLDRIAHLCMHWSEGILFLPPWCNTKEEMYAFLADKADTCTLVAAAAEVQVRQSPSKEAQQRILNNAKAIMQKIRSSQSGLEDKVKQHPQYLSLSEDKERQQYLESEVARLKTESVQLVADSRAGAIQCITCYAVSQFRVSTQDLSPKQLRVVHTIRTKPSQPRIDRLLEVVTFTGRCDRFLYPDKAPKPKVAKSGSKPKQSTKPKEPKQTANRKVVPKPKTEVEISGVERLAILECNKSNDGYTFAITETPDDHSLTVIVESCSSAFMFFKEILKKCKRLETKVRLLIAQANETSAKEAKIFIDNNAESLVDAERAQKMKETAEKAVAATTATLKMQTRTNTTPAENSTVQGQSAEVVEATPAVLEEGTQTETGADSVKESIKEVDPFAESLKNFCELQKKVADGVLKDLEKRRGVVKSQYKNPTLDKQEKKLLKEERNDLKTKIDEQALVVLDMDERLQAATRRAFRPVSDIFKQNAKISAVAGFLWNTSKSKAADRSEMQTFAHRIGLVVPLSDAQRKKYEDVFDKRIKPYRAVKKRKTRAPDGDNTPSKPRPNKKKSTIDSDDDSDNILLNNKKRTSDGDNTPSKPVSSKKKRKESKGEESKELKALRRQLAKAEEGKAAAEAKAKEDTAAALAKAEEDKAAALAEAKEDKAAALAKAEEDKAAAQAKAEEDKAAAQAKAEEDAKALAKAQEDKEDAQEKYRQTTIKSNMKYWEKQKSEHRWTQMENERLSTLRGVLDSLKSLRVGKRKSYIELAYRWSDARTAFLLMINGEISDSKIQDMNSEQFEIATKSLTVDVMEPKLQELYEKEQKRRENLAIDLDNPMDTDTAVENSQQTVANSTSAKVTKRKRSEGSDATVVDPTATKPEDLHKFGNTEENAISL